MGRGKRNNGNNARDAVGIALSDSVRSRRVPKITLGPPPLRIDQLELAAALYGGEEGEAVTEVPETKSFERFRDKFDFAGTVYELERHGIEFLSRSGEGYPKRLERLEQPPLGLFVRGDREVLKRRMVAVCGARSASKEATKLAYEAGASLAQAGFVVVSGLARGVDAAAHRGALEHGETVAVLGAGLDNIYPEMHKDLAELVAERGLLVSEFAPVVEPAPWRFPFRNRLIAGLVEAVVVVEARRDSSSPEIGETGLALGDKVFAASVTLLGSEKDAGARLVELGATPFTAAEDLVAALP